MFTGIVQAVGKIVRLDPLEIESAAFDLSDVAVGDSICVQGACLTVTALTRKGFTADVSAETRSVTAGLDRAGALVNLEKSLALGERLGGHLVAGHVDGEAFDAYLIPHTLEVTSLARLAAGARVNLEIDLIARYVERLLAQSRT